MKIAFYKGKSHNIDKFICLYTQSKYSHVELIDDKNTDDTTQWEWYSSSYIDGGVRMKNISINPDHWEIYDFIETLPNKKYVLTFLKRQIGKKYDILGIILSFIIPFNVHVTNQWFCSEMISHILKNINILDTELNPNQITPKILYSLLYRKIKLWKIKT